jgi:dolichyldiphosphatase
MNSGSKRVFEFTYAEYPSDDPWLGIAMIFASFIPHIIAIYTISIVIYAKCRRHFVFLIGLIISHEFAKLVKRIWRQPRPDGAFLTSFGMPSDHAMFTLYTNTFVLLFLSTRQLDRRSFSMTVGSSAMISLLVCYSRLFLQVHTLEQVLVGIIMGIMWGCSWFYISRKYILNSRPLITIFERSHTFIHDLFLGGIQSKEKSQIR